MINAGKHVVEYYMKYKEAYLWIYIDVEMFVKCNNHVVSVGYQLYDIYPCCFGTIWSPRWTGYLLFWVARVA